MDIFESLENLNVSEECFNEIMGIVEEIINEVSVNMWKKAAVNSLARRGFEEGRMDPTVDAVVKKKKWSDKDEKELDKHFNAVDRTRHAEEVAHLPSSNMSANKALKAAKKVTPSRNKQAREEFNKWYDTGHISHKAHELADRRNHAKNLLSVKKEF